MAIPKFDELIPPVLGDLSKAGIGTIKWNELEDPIARQVGLSDEEKATEYDSGNGRIFLYRISCALTYLSIAKLIELLIGHPRYGFNKNKDLSIL